ncbi:MAG: PspA/IM30 family protein [Planctomycetaceae bacterium]
MPHFSRLTDIITCSLTQILSESSDPVATLREVIDEMEEGLAGARRTARTAAANRDRLRREIDEHSAQVTSWHEKARTALAASDESGARDALTRKVEVEDLVDGLRPELDAAESTRQHMLRIQKALEARHAEALRRLTELTGEEEPVRLESETAVHSAALALREKSSEVEAELEALRKELGG